MNVADIWFGILVLEIVLYVVLDGADLGIGVITLWHRKEHVRSVMMQSIGPVWDANETWLVVAAATLFGAFPTAYATVLPLLAVPIMLMIFGLMTRAVSFEMHRHSARKTLWSTVFSVGSIVAVLGQAFTVGGLLTASTGLFGFFSGFSVLLALAVFVGYVALGYAYLIRHTALRLEMRRGLQVAATAGLVLGFVVFALLPEHINGAVHAWEGPLGLVFVALLGILVACFTTVFFSSRRLSTGVSMYWWVAGGIVAASAFAVLTLYPYIIPGVLTIDAAAASQATLHFMLVGIIPIIPIVLLYNLLVHRVFGGKMDTDELYEE